MKVFSAKEIRELDRLTCEEEGINPIDLMERASRNFVKMLEADIGSVKRAVVFCGLGNNGGDGLAIARMLKNQGAEVRVVVIRYSENVSPLFLINEQLLQGVGIEPINFPQDDLPDISENEIVIDAILGNGINRVAEGAVKEAIEQINRLKNFVVSVDLPSGLYGDAPTPMGSVVVRSSRIYTFQFPKMAFFMPQNADYAPEFKIVDIGLSAKGIDEASAKATYITKDIVCPIWKPRGKFSYKNNFGHGLVIGGSLGMIGAPLITADACLRAGAGLVTALVPSCGLNIFQSALPQVMCLKQNSEEILEGEVPEISKYTALAVGPGMGTSKGAEKFLLKLLDECNQSMVIDADALNIIASNKGVKIPKVSILTPHEGELKRLIGNWTNDFEKIEKAQKFAMEKQVVMLVKGAHSCIIDVDGSLCFNSSGNPALAKAGSGDLLTGIILAFLCQGESPISAAKKAVFLHGLCADSAIMAKTEHGIVISDLLIELSRIGNC